MPHLAALRLLTPVLGISLEPMLGPVDISRWIGKGRRYLDWVIIGGESGPNARPCSQGWITDVIAQCTEERVPVFVKQLGANSNGLQTANPDPVRWAFNHPKGGDPEEWPFYLRRRQFPETVRRTL